MRFFEKLRSASSLARKIIVDEEDGDNGESDPTILARLYISIYILPSGYTHTHTGYSTGPPIVVEWEVCNVPVALQQLCVYPIESDASVRPCDVPSCAPRMDLRPRCPTTDDRGGGVARHEHCDWRKWMGAGDVPSAWPIAAPAVR